MLFQIGLVPQLDLLSRLKSLSNIFLVFSLSLLYCIELGATEKVEDFLSLQTRIQEIFETSKLSIVRVKATRERIENQKTRRLLKMGSGFFVSKDGHVLTTGLLVNPDRIWIEHDGSFFLAEQVGRDPLCNLSLLKVSEKPKNFNFVSLSDPPFETPVGSIIVGLTCALEFEVGPTQGLLQSEEFSFGTRPFPTKLLRTSLALGPGEVGAPVFDLQGRFVGISHAALPDLRSCFLLPAAACLRIREDLMFSGEVNYGWFGITTSRKLNSNSGFDVFVQSLIENSPAMQSKLKVGDIIRKVGMHPVTKEGDLAHSAFFARPGTFVEFLVVRDQKELKIPVKVARRPLAKDKNESKDNRIAEVDGVIPEDESFGTSSKVGPK